MRSHPNTAAPMLPMLGQGALDLPGLFEVWLVWSELGIVSLSLPNRAPGDVEADLVDRGLEPPPVRDVPEAWAHALVAYARGEAIDPSELPVDLRGTPFQLGVWQALRRIPRGQVRSYAAIAAEVGNPRATRAVGMANHANPVAIVVPCHRVVASDLGLGGYACGLATKQRLLELEGVKVLSDRVTVGQLDLWGLLH